MWQSYENWDCAAAMRSITAGASAASIIGPIGFGGAPFRHPVFLTQADQILLGQVDKLPGNRLSLEQEMTADSQF
jgi:hypothetical protein